MAEGNEKIIWYKNEIIRQIVSLSFIISLLAYVFFYLVEILSSNFVSRFYSLNYHLVFVIIFGFFTALFTSDNKEEETVKPNTKVKAREYVYIFILSLISAGLIGYKTMELGRLSLLIAALAGLLIFFLSLSLMFDKDEDGDDNNN